MVYNVNGFLMLNTKLQLERSILHLWNRNTKQVIQVSWIPTEKDTLSAVFLWYKISYKKLL